MNHPFKTMPKWVEGGASLLSMNAGYINAIGVMSFEHQSVSHVTGSSTLLGLSVLHLNVTSILFLSGILFSFFMGSVLAGYLLHGSSLKLGRHYDTALYLEAMLLFSTLYFLSHDSKIGHYLASAACGLQNSLATTYSGAIIRTTHLTGIFTDLGILFGHRLRGAEIDFRRVKLFLIIISSFIVGGMTGGFCFLEFHHHSILAPAVLCLALAMSYQFYRSKKGLDRE